MNALTATLRAGPQGGNPTNVARETLRQLAARRIAPTPENYRNLYLEIAGERNTAHTQRSQADLQQALAEMRSREQSDPVAVDALATALEEKTWQACAQALLLLSGRILGAPEFTPSPPRLAEVPAGNTPVPDALRALLAHILESPIVAQLGIPLGMNDEAHVLAGRVRAGRDDETAVTQVRSFLGRLELQAEDASELHQGVFRLLRLVIENIADLVSDDRWVEGQLDALHDLLAAPYSLYMLREAEACLRDVLSRQSGLRASLRDAKTNLRSMVETLIDRLGTLSDDTGTYQAKIEVYSRRIEAAEDISELGTLLDDLLTDTRHIHAVATITRDDLVSARKRAENAEQRVRELEHELANVSTQIREDQLTGTLNRRGLEEAFDRESARAGRRDLPLAIAMLDIDNFKLLNDHLGHRAGDSALKHLVKVIRETLRPSDIVCRFGGEEFLVLLPDTSTPAATDIIVRLQRELTRRFFLHQNERVLITFSAGVALWQPGESQDAAIGRADRALYQAKDEGKNRVCSAG